MLNKNKGIRYSSFEIISGHKWFQGFDWDALISLAMEPEIIHKLEEKENYSKNKKSYIEYINSLPNFEKKVSKNKITEDEKLKFEEWFTNF